MTMGERIRSQEGEASNRELPPALAPLEYLVGRWKGQGVSKDDPALKFRGWTETHTWAWIFDKGTPAGLTLDVQGGKRIARGKLTFDLRDRRYRLEARTVGAREGSQPVVYTGNFDSNGKRLELEAAGEAGRERLTIRPNGNYVRYVMTVDRNEPGARSFTPRFEAGLTREGESLAAGASAQERPRCIVTGGAASLTVSYQGQSYPICCTGCRDEFNENPEKYLRKLSLRSPAAGDSKAKPKSASKISRFEDAFASDVSAEDPEVKSEMKPGRRPPAPGEADSAKAQKPAPSVEPSEKKSASRAATALRLAQNLERSGKTDNAMKAFRQLVKDYPGTAQARIAATRIKALEGN
jgi:YHS domain-containing protein